MDSKLSRIVLRAKIRGLSQAALKSRTLINSTHGRVRDHHWCTKRAIGAEARWHILASAFLRGIPYREVEKHTNGLSNPVMVLRVGEIAWEHGVFCSQTRGLKEVQAWLRVPEKSRQENTTTTVCVSSVTPPVLKPQGIVQKTVQWVGELLS